MHLTLTSLLLLGSSFSLTSAHPRATEGHVKCELDFYEERYINSRSYKHPNETAKLVGCKKMKIPAEEVHDFEEHYRKKWHELQKFESHFYDESKKEVRVYFPVENALVSQPWKSCHCWS